ncbi:hypothetical protein ACE6H2_014366 [Prunus campanulata]
MLMITMISLLFRRKTWTLSDHRGEIVSKEESDVVQSNGASKTCELRVSFTQLFTQQSRAESQGEVEKGEYPFLHT